MQTETPGTIQQAGTTDDTPQSTGKPEPKQSRAQRRASLRMQNNKLWQNRELLVKELERLQKNNENMNGLLNLIVAIVRPQVALEGGKNAADLLLARLKELVELEKRVKEKEEKENPMLTLNTGGAA